MSTASSLVLIIARTPGGSQVAAQPPWHSWKGMGLVMQMSNPTALPIFPILPGVRGTIWLILRPSGSLGPLLLFETNSKAYISLPHSSEGSSQILSHISLPEIFSLLDSFFSSVLHAPFPLFCQEPFVNKSLVN